VWEWGSGDEGWGVFLGDFCFFFLFGGIELFVRCFYFEVDVVLRALFPQVSTMALMSSNQKILVEGKSCLGALPWAELVTPGKAAIQRTTAPLKGFPTTTGPLVTCGMLKLRQPRGRKQKKHSGGVARSIGKSYKKGRPGHAASTLATTKRPWAGRGRATNARATQTSGGVSNHNDVSRRSSGPGVSITTFRGEEKTNIDFPF